MSELQKNKKILQDNKKKLKDKYKIKKLGIFGSIVKGKSTKTSDIDILVEFSDIPSIFIFIKLENELSDILKRQVDLVTPKALKKSTKKEILRTVKYV